MYKQWLILFLQELKQIGSRSIQSQDLCPKIIQEYLTGEKLKNQINKIKSQGYQTIFYTFRSS